jgi:heme/copper-type cytochrome/quinol oxidase subunit 4
MFSLTGIPGLQVNLFIYSSVMYLIYVNIVSPYDASAQVNVDTVNEFMLLCISYHFLLFVDLVQDPEIKYKLGWTLVALIMLVVAANIVYIAIFSIKGSLHQRKLDKIKKKHAQRAQNIEATISLFKEDKQND